MRRFFQSLTFRIGLMVIAIEAVILTVCGLYFINRFSNEIEDRVETHIQIPGALMSRGLLDFDSISDPDVMGRMVEGDLVSGLVIGAGDRVLYALNPGDAGRPVTETSEAAFIGSLGPDITGSQTRRIKTGGESYYVCLTRLELAEARAADFLYLRVSTAELDRQQDRLTMVFVLGLASCVLLTSLSIIFVFRRVVSTRIANWLDVLERVKGGDLTVRVDDYDRDDEFGLIQRGLNDMVAKLETTIGSLEQHVADLEQAESSEREQRTLSVALRGTVATLTSTLQLDEVLARVLDLVAQVVPHDAATIMLLEGGVARVVGRRGYAERGLDEEVQAVRYPVAETANLRQMIETNQGMTLDDVRDYPGWVHSTSTDWIRSYIGAPIRLERHVIGFLNLDKSTRAFYTPEHVDRLQTFADQIAITLRNAQLFEGEQRRRRVAETLEQAAAVLNSTLELDEVLDRILQQLRKAIAFDTASIHRIDGGFSEIIAHHGFPRPQKLLGMRFPVEPKFPNMRIVVERKPLSIPDILEEYPHFKEESATYESGHIRSWLGVPLLIKDRVIGMIALDRARVQPYTPEDVELVTAFANQAAIAIENAWLHQSMRERATRLALVGQVGQQAASILELNELLIQAVELIRETFGFFAVNILLVEDEMLVLRASSLPELAEQGEAIWLRIDAGSIVTHAVQFGEPLVVADVTQDARYMRMVEAEAPARSELVVPIKLRDEAIGVLMIDSETVDAFSGADVATMQTIADQLAVAINNARLYEQIQRHAEDLERRVSMRTSELQRMLERIEAILNNSPDAVLLLSPSGAIRMGNPAFDDMFGYEIDEVVNQNPEILVAPDGVDAFNAALLAASGRSETRRFEIVAQHRNGRTFDADVAFAPIREQGEVTGLVCSVRDISALKEVERMKDAFVSNVSHELRTPITNIKLRQRLLALQPQKTNDHLTVIQRETERLSRIIEDLLHLSRLDQERVTIDLAATDLNALTDQYVGDRQPLADSLGLTLSLEALPDLPLVQVDAGLVGQVLSIMLTNALNYTPRGGQVTVQTLSSAGENSQWVGFSVRDTGPGIPPDEMPSLFDRFFRGTAGIESGAPGTGLGLSIAQMIIAKHHGRIEVDSPGEGQGAVFSVWLPVC